MIYAKRITINGKRVVPYTKIGWCIVCDTPFEMIGKGSNRKYCKVCSLNKALESRRKYNQKRPPRREYIREKVAESRANGNTKRRETLGTVNIIGKPPENPTQKDWDKELNKIRKMKQEAMGGYVEYIDVDEDNYEDDY